MNRYRRSLTQIHHPSTQLSAAEFAGATPNMYFIEESEPKRPNIISRGGKMRNTSPPQTSMFVQGTAAGTPQNYQQQQLNYQIMNQNQGSGPIVTTTMQLRHEEAIPEVISTNSGTFNSKSDTIISSDPLDPGTSTIITSNSTAGVENENLTLDQIPFHLLGDENTQTFLNNGQFETIETEDGNVLLILKEDIENPSAAATGTGETDEDSVVPNDTLPLTAEVPVSTIPGSSTYPLPLIDHDVTTCTSSIESPISSIGVNTSVVQQQQEQIEQQHQQHQQQQHQLIDSSSLIQMTQQQLETIDLSEQIIVNSSENDDLQPQSYFLLQMSDGTSYLVPTDSVENVEALQQATTSPEAIVAPTLPDLKPTKPRPTAAAAVPRPPKPKLKTPKPKPPTPAAKSVKQPMIKTSSTPFKIQIQSQPPPLVPTKRKELTTAAAVHQHRQQQEQQPHNKPYRFIMSEADAEERRDNTLPMNPFVVKVLSQPPVTSPARLSTPTATTSSGASKSGGGPPKLILKAPFNVSTTSQSISSSSTLTDMNLLLKGSDAAAADGEGVIDLGDGTYKCSLCPKITKLRINMVNHINRYHKGETPYPCPDCSETFQYASTLRAHHQKVHVIKVFKCVPCGINFATEADLKLHFTSIHSTQKNVFVVSSSSTAGAGAAGTSSLLPTTAKFTCEECKKQFTTKNTLMRHKIDHWDIGRDGPIPCDECPKSFPTKVNYLNHMQAHKDGLLSHTCEICAKGLKTEQYLRNHMLIHQKAGTPNKSPVSVTLNHKTTTPSSQTPSSTTATNSSPAAVALEPPVIKFLNSPQPTFQIQQQQIPIITPSSPPKTKRINQVFLCSRCDVIFTTSEQLKAHFDEKHPHLIGKQQVVLKSTRVPAHFLEKKLTQQKLDLSKLTPTSPTKIMETLNVGLGGAAAMKPLPTRLPDVAASSTPLVITQKEETANKVEEKLNATEVRVPSSPTKVSLPNDEQKSMTAVEEPEKLQLQGQKASVSISEMKAVVFAKKPPKSDHLTQTSPTKTTMTNAKLSNGKPGATTTAKEAAAMKSMAAIAQVHMMEKKLKKVSTSTPKTNGNPPAPVEVLHSINNEAQKSKTHDEQVQKTSPAEEESKVVAESPNPNGQSEVPSTIPTSDADAVAVETETGSKSPKRKAAASSPPPSEPKEIKKRKSNMTTPITQTRVSTRQNKGQSSKNTDFEFYAAAAATNSESDHTHHSQVNAKNANAVSNEAKATEQPATPQEKSTSTTLTTSPLTEKKKVGRPRKRPASESDDKDVEEEVRATSPKRKASLRAASPQKTSNTTPETRTRKSIISQPNGNGRNRIATRGSMTTTGRQKK